MLALTRIVANETLPRPTTGDAVFFDLPLLGLVVYPVGFSLPLAVVAVILGGVLLSEHVPLSTWTALAYAACLAAILSGAVVLGADPVTGRGERPGDSSGKESPGRP